MQVIYSNRIERLFETLQENLYAIKNPFAKRLVMVATAPLKAWLMLELAEKVGVAAGLEVGTIDETFRKLLKPERPFPKTEELAMALEMEIQSLLQAPFREEKWEPLIRYLGNERKKLTPFSFELAQLFQRYNLYGNRLGDEWDNGGWQRGLWDRLFACDTAPWSSPYIHFACGAATVLPQSSLDVFAVSFLPKVQLDFLQRLSKKIPVRFYCLSPCEFFWSDLSPDCKTGFQTEQPLLTNFGKVGRIMAQWIEESSAETLESYPNVQPKTLLEHLQNDMQILRNYSETEPLTLDNDPSVQIHGAPTLTREVEIVHQLLLQIVKDKNVKPRDILVMAPDISVYAPFIPSIFDGKYFKPHISDLRMPALEPLIQSFLHLLAFAKGRWSSQDFYNLLESPFFLKKRRWDHQKVMLIKEWIEGSGILWGEDAEHRQMLLKKMYGEEEKSPPQNSGTWKFGFERLLAGLIQTAHPSIAPYSLIESTQGELLGELIELFDSLKRDLTPFIDKTEFTLSEWGLKLKKLFLDYLDPSLVEGQSEPIFKAVEGFQRAGRRYDPATVPFSTIEKHLDYLLCQTSTRYKESDLQTVRFCSLLPLRTVPAKVIVLMGMEEGSFPRPENLLSFDLLYKNPSADFCPSKGDMDRFIFLEALLSARDTIVFTYQCKNREDFKEQAPSLLIDELLNCIDKGYRTKILSLIHPLNRFDTQYFKESSLFRNTSAQDFAAAQIHSQSSKRKHQFIDDIPLPLSHHSLETIAFEDLKAFLKDPFKTYFNKTLGMFLEREVKEREEPFVHSSLEFHALKNKVTAHPLNAILHLAQKEGSLPVPHFTHTAVTRLQEELEAFRAFGISPDSVEEVEFRLPLSVPLAGKLSLVSPVGLIVRRKKNYQSLVEAWPAFLVYLHLQKGEKQLLFLGDGNTIDGSTINPEQELEKLIEYYLGAMQQGSPLDPGLIANGKSYSDYVAWIERGSAITITEEWREKEAQVFGTLKRVLT